MTEQFPWYRQVGDPERGLYVELRELVTSSGTTPQLAIGRQEGGLVVIALDEARDLCAAIAEAAADLAAAVGAGEEGDQ